MKIKNKGFTLVELIIVIAVIAILAAVLAPRYIQYVERSRQTNDLQIATNLMRAATTAVADPKSNVPAGALIEVLWATGDARPEQHLYGGRLYVRPAQPNYRVSVLSQNGVPGIDSTVDLDNLTKMILGIMGVSEHETDVSGDGVVGMMEDAQSAAGNESSFCFHIDTSTGDIALAGYSIDGDVNVWVDKIGVNITRAP